MKTLRTAIVIAVIAVFAAFTGPAKAQVLIHTSEDIKLYINLATVGTLQTLDQKNVFNAAGVQQANLTSGMQTAFGDLGFTGKFGKNEEIEMYFDLYLASRNHPSTTYGNQGYLIIRDIPENLSGLQKILHPVFKLVDLKAGAFLIDFGDHLNHRSNNAISQLNPLVGNTVIDPNLVAVGAEVISKPGRVNWLVGVTNGTNTEDFSVGRGIAYNAKVWAFPIKPLRTSVSYFQADHSESVTSRATLFSGNRSGERYGGVLGGGQAPGGILAGAGKYVQATQIDVTWDQPAFPVKLYGHYGRMSDKDLNGPAPGQPEDQWNYFAGEVVYKFTPSIYAAARYSGARARQLANVDSSGTVDRIQLGGGLWLTRHMLVKAEYMQQQYNGFVAGNMVNNGIQAWRDPEFSGFVAEVSFAF